MLLLDAFPITTYDWCQEQSPIELNIIYPT